MVKLAEQLTATPLMPQSCKNNFFVDRFFGSVMDAVHSSAPFHLFLCFQLLGDICLLCYLLYQKSEPRLRWGINVSQIAVQLTAENQIGV